MIWPKRQRSVSSMPIGLMTATMKSIARKSLLHISSLLWRTNKIIPLTASKIMISSTSATIVQWFHFIICRANLIVSITMPKKGGNQFVPQFIQKLLFWWSFEIFIGSDIASICRQNRARWLSYRSAFDNCIRPTSDSGMDPAPCALTFESFASKRDWKCFTILLCRRLVDKNH